MSLRIIIISLTFSYCTSYSQTISKVYKINELVARIDSSKTTLIVNFWATWCKPCIQELPSFDSLSISEKNIKVILVSLDFKEDIETKVNPFLKKHNIQSECVLLDEINGNDFINKISKEWSGAIPATLIKKNDRKTLLEKKLHMREILFGLNCLSPTK